MTIDERIQALRAKFPQPEHYEPDCPRCNDTGWWRRYIPYREPHVSLCVCQQARVAEQRLARAGIPPEYRGCTFANYRAYTPALIDGLALARGYAERFPIQASHTDPTGLVFIGQTGVGKTHLAAAILTAIMARTGIDGRFYTTCDLLQRMRDSYSATTRTTERQILEPILTCGLLVLDDLGAERLTDWVATTMDYVIDTRYTTGRPIVITTNFPDVDDDQEVNGLWWRVGFRSRSRLHKMCRFMTLDGADYRDVSPEASERDLRRLGRQRGFVSPTRNLRPGPRPTPKDGKGELRWPGGKGGNS
jgi:DNA replication protein DnaC